MRLNYNKILSNFPEIELSYEKNMYKNTLSVDFYLAIPKGRKFFAWFHYYNSEPVCYLLCINRNRRSIDNINIITCCFDKSLCIGNGTILYGTIFHLKNKKFFNIEDLHYFKNKYYSTANQFEKLKVLKKIHLKYIKQVSISNNDIIFGLPIMDTNELELRKSLKTVPYDIFFIQGRNLYQKTTFYNKKCYIEKEIYANFLIRPTIKHDIYELYHHNNIGELIKYDYAYINSYKKSVFMNKLFRNIKENRNLDALEESDDEEEFENIREDKFVYLEREFIFKCKYLKKFNMWVPIELNKDALISNGSNLIVKNNKN